MNFNDFDIFIKKESNWEYLNRGIKVVHIKEAEKLLGCNFGMETKYYLLNYGMIYKDDIEINGLISDPLENSPLIKATKFLHDNYEKMQKYIVISTNGWGDMYLVNQYDEIYLLKHDVKTLESQNCTLFDWIKNVK